MLMVEVVSAGSVYVRSYTSPQCVEIVDRVSRCLYSEPVANEGHVLNKADRQRLKAAGGLTARSQGC
jgi:hypothetical protein